MDSPGPGGWNGARERVHQGEAVVLGGSWVMGESQDSTVHEHALGGRPRSVTSIPTTTKHLLVLISTLSPEDFACAKAPSRLPSGFFVDRPLSSTTFSSSEAMVASSSSKRTCAISATSAAPQTRLDRLQARAARSPHQAGQRVVVTTQQSCALVSAPMGVANTSKTTRMGSQIAEPSQVFLPQPSVAAGYRAPSANQLSNEETVADDAGQGAALVVKHKRAPKSSQECRHTYLSTPAAVQAVSQDETHMGTVSAGPLADPTAHAPCISEPVSARKEPSKPTRPTRVRRPVSTLTIDWNGAKTYGNSVSSPDGGDPHGTSSSHTLDQTELTEPKSANTAASAEHGRESIVSIASTHQVSPNMPLKDWEPDVPADSASTDEATLAATHHEPLEAAPPDQPEPTEPKSASTAAPAEHGHESIASTHQVSPNMPLKDWKPDSPADSASMDEAMLAATHQPLEAPPPASANRGQPEPSSVTQPSQTPQRIIRNRARAAVPMVPLTATKCATDLNLPHSSIHASSSKRGCRHTPLPLHTHTHTHTHTHHPLIRVHTTHTLCAHTYLLFWIFASGCTLLVSSVGDCSSPRLAQCDNPQAEHAHTKPTQTRDLPISIPVAAPCASYLLPVRSVECGIGHPSPTPGRRWQRRAGQPHRWCRSSKSQRQRR